MQKFSRYLVMLAALVVGFVLGAGIEYSTINAKKTRQLLTEYQNVKDHFHMTDEEMAEAGKKMPQYFEEEKQQDRMAAANALAAFRDLAKGNVEDAKADLLFPIGMYYRLYHANGGDSDLIAYIETASKEFPEIAAEIAKKK